VSIPLITSTSLLSQLFSLIRHGLSKDVMTINMTACSLLDSVLKLVNLLYASCGSLWSSQLFEASEARNCKFSG